MAFDTEFAPLVRPGSAKIKMSSMSDANPISIPPNFPSPARAHRHLVLPSSHNGCPDSHTSCFHATSSALVTTISANSVSSSENAPNGRQCPRTCRMSIRNKFLSLNSFNANHAAAALSAVSQALCISCCSDSRSSRTASSSGFASKGNNC